MDVEIFFYPRPDRVTCISCVSRASVGKLENKAARSSAASGRRGRNSMLLLAAALTLRKAPRATIDWWPGCHLQTVTRPRPNAADRCSFQVRHDDLFGWLVGSG